jgi:hypothetical protein
MSETLAQPANSINKGSIVFIVIFLDVCAYGSTSPPRTLAILLRGVARSSALGRFFLSHRLGARRFRK